MEGAGWQVSIAAINIFQVAGVIDFAIAKGVGMAMRAIGPLVRELKAIRDIGNLSDDFGREIGREIAGDIRKLQPNREDFLYQKALKERDAVVSEIRKLPRKNQHPVATVVGGYNKETGEIAVGIKRPPV